MLHRKELHSHGWQQYPAYVGECYLIVLPAAELIPKHFFDLIIRHGQVESPAEGPEGLKPQQALIAAISRAEGISNRPQPLKLLLYLPQQQGSYSSAHTRSFCRPYERHTGCMTSSCSIDSSIT